MTPKRRALALLAVAAASFLIGALGVIAWRTHLALKQSKVLVQSENLFAVSVRPLGFLADHRFDWFAAPAIFTGGSVFDGRLFLCGPAGLYVYSATGNLETIYRVGKELPTAPLVTLATGTLSGAHGPELLIATSGAGVLAFDGARFRQIAAISPDQTGVLDSDANTVTALLPLSSGRMLIGTAKRGLLVYDGQEIHYFHDDFRNIYITALAGTEASLWIGTESKGLFHWQGGEAVQLDPAQGLPDSHVSSIALTGNSTFAATPMGVAEIAQGRVQRILAQGIFAQAVFASHNRLTVGSLQQGIVDISLSQRIGLHSHIDAPGLDSGKTRDPDQPSIQQIFTSAGTFYAVAQNALYQSDPEGTWRKVIAPTPSMLNDRNISALAVDDTGRLWVGYFDRGLDIISPRLDHAAHVENDHIFCINRILPDTARHTVDVATANGLAVFDSEGRERQLMGRPSGLISDHITDVALYRGGMALATPAGITFLDDAGAHSIYAFQGLVNNHVYALGQHDGQLLAGTLGGISILHNDTITANLTTSSSRLRHNWITAVVPDNDGWWVGTYGAGVEHLDAANHFETTDATVNGIDINPNAMLATPEHILAGSLDHGLLIFNRKSQRWRMITAGLPSRNVTAFAAAAGMVYIGTDNGLVKIPEERLDE